MSEAPGPRPGSKHPEQVAKIVEEQKTRKVQRSDFRLGVSYSRVAGGSKGSSGSGASSGADALEEIVEKLIRRLVPEIIRSLNG